MKHKRAVICILVGILCIGFLGGCAKLPWGFNSSEEAQKYVLKKLKHKYHETFVFTEEPTYKEEKIGIHWISGEIAPEDDPDKTATVYARNTAMFEDTYHAYYFADRLSELASKLFEDKDYIKDTCITVKGRGSDTKWIGKETLNEYLEKGEYQIIADIYLYENLSDEEYVEQTSLLIKEISGCGLHVQMDIWDKSDEWIYRAFPDDGELAEDKDEILRKIHSHRSLMESIEDYEEWKKENQKDKSLMNTE